MNSTTGMLLMASALGGGLYWFVLGPGDLHLKSHPSQVRSAPVVAQVVDNAAPSAEAPSLHAPTPEPSAEPTSNSSQTTDTIGADDRDTDVNTSVAGLCYLLANASAVGDQYKAGQITQDDVDTWVTSHGVVHVSGRAPVTRIGETSAECDGVPPMHLWKIRVEAGSNAGLVGYVVDANLDEEP